MRQFIIIFLSVCWSPMHPQQPVRQWDSLTNAYRSNHIQGVVLVAKGDSILYNEAWGYADMGKEVDLRVNTLFKMESTGKMFTATAIMQLVEQGKLSLHNTVTESLPELPLKNADKITIHHLLTHTSGLASPWDIPDYNFKRSYSRLEMENIICDMPLVFATPGKDMYYSNSSYIILSWIIEKASGLSFDEYVTTHFFTPQEMKTIRHLKDTLMPPEGAQPYRFVNSKRFVTQNEIISPMANGAGGWVATAFDLYRFMLGLDTHKFISPPVLMSMRTANGTKAIDSTYQGYAYGLEVYNNDPVKGVNYFGHSGGGAGFSIDAILDPVSHTIVIFCSNTFMNSRGVSSNYLRLALDTPVVPIKIASSIIVYDFIEARGMGDFIANEKQYFKELGIAPDDRLFMNVSDAMEMIGDYKSLVDWAELGIRYFPENGFLYLMEGNGYARLNEKVEAVKSFEAARAIAAKNRDVRMQEEADHRIKLIH